MMLIATVVNASVIFFFEYKNICVILMIKNLYQQQSTAAAAAAVIMKIIITCKIKSWMNKNNNNYLADNMRSKIIKYILEI